MSYIGQGPQFASFPSKFFNGDGSAMTVTLDYAPPNLASLLVFIDGVRQDTSAYTLSGTSLTFTGTVASGTANVQVVHLGLQVDVGVPGADTITSAMIVDGAVVNADLADMAANTVKVRDANSSGVPSDKALATTQILIGDGTGFTAAALSSDVTMTNAGAVTIANDAVTTAKILDNNVTLAKIADGTQGGTVYYGASGAPTELATRESGYFLKTQGAGANPVWAAAGGDDNTPAFAAYLNGTITSFPDEAWTKIAINAEDFDSDGAFDPTTNYRFTVPAGEGGKYFFTASATTENGNNDGEKFYVGLYVNGSRVMETSEDDNTVASYGWNSTTGVLSGILVLSAADYVELYAYTRSQNGGGTPFIATGTHNTRLVGYKMIGL